MRRRVIRLPWLPLVCLSLTCAVAGCGEPTAALGAPEIAAANTPPLPNKTGSLKFAVIGDSGRWSRVQRELASRLASEHERFAFDFVLMLGDNNYGDGSPESFRVRFEEPYKPLLDAGVKFYATLGNHDETIGEQWKYPLFNMEGHRYLTFDKKTGPLPPVAGTSVRFFAVDSTALDADQLAWLDRETAKSNAGWEIVFLHHPLYTTGRYAFTSRLRRRTLESVLVRNGVDVVLAGHEHFYQRLVPQQGIVHFVAGGSGSVRTGEMKASTILAKGYDKDLSFMLVEISGDTLYFQAINRLGATVDSGRIIRKRTRPGKDLGPQSAAPSRGTQ